MCPHVLLTSKHPSDLKLDVACGFEKVKGVKLKH